MDDMQMEQVRRQEQQMQQEERRQQMHEHLNRLQNWDLEEGQTLSQRRAAHNEMLIGKELEQNEQLRVKWMQTKLSLHAKKTAEGRPAQIQKPAKKTFKQKREDARLDQVAKQKAPFADHVSLHMVESLRSYQQLRDNSFDMITPEELQQAEETHVDLRVVHVYLNGYKKNAAGEPENETEQRRRDDDRNMIDAFLSRDLQRKRPYLDRMVDQVLKVNIADDMLTEEYLEYHAGEIQEQINRMVCMQNLMNDSVNKEYFDKLPPYVTELLKTRVIDRYAQYGAVMARISSVKSLDPDTGKLQVDARDQNDVEMLKQTLVMEREAMKMSLAQSRIQEHQMIESEYRKLFEAERENLKTAADSMRDQIEKEHTKTAKGADMSGLNLTGFVAGYALEDLANYKKMIEDHPQEYRRHALLIDDLYQQLYRTIDSYSDLKMKVMAAQGVVDELNDRIRYGGEAKNVFMRKAMLELDEATASSEVVQLQMNAITDAMACLLKDIPMSQPAAELIHRLGY